MKVTRELGFMEPRASLMFIEIDNGLVFLLLIKLVAGN